MFQSRYRICEAFGIPVYVNGSFLFLLLLFAVNSRSLAIGAQIAIMLAVSVVMHELAHALTARAFGYRTRDITLSLLGGCASLIALPRKASQEFLTALAGPLMSFALALCGMVGISAVALDGTVWDAAKFVLSEAFASLLGISLQWEGGLLFSKTSIHLAQTIAYFSVMNAILGLFNLVPGFPLDGGRIFRSLMRRFMSRVRATYVAMVVGRGVAILIALQGVFDLFHGGFISILIAWMIWREGYREYLAARTDDDFRGWSQEDFNARVSPPPYER